MRRAIPYGLALLFALCVVPNCGDDAATQPGEYSSGLVGAWYGESDLTNCKGADLIGTLEPVWSEKDDRGSEWSAKWEGSITAPVSGEITLHVETAESAVVQIDGKQVVAVLEGQGRQSGTVSMRKGEAYPIVVTYSHEGGFDGFLTVKWSWTGQDETSVPADSLRHTAEQARYWNWQPDPDPESIDFSKYVKARGKNLFVYKAPGRFGGWPANNGIWCWDNEIVVGFAQAYYKYSRYGHSWDGDRPELKVLARSLDGGETWTVEDPDNFVGDGLEPVPLTEPVNFAHPDFAMCCSVETFFISYDRCRSWQGPFDFPDFGTDDLSSRTDYIVNGRDDCLFFLSAKEERVEAESQDRAFCARTTDGGKTVEFLSWMTEEPIKARSVMSSTVRISDNELVSAMRRRHDVRRDNLPDITRNWIDAYRSKDNGRTWEFLSKVADTDTGKQNGSPPALVRLRDGRLCVAYGYRAVPLGIRAKISSDNGKTWGEEIHLRDDGATWDTGYPCMVQRPDGKLVTIYYFNTKEIPEQHIAATIWDPDAVDQ